tara:strand:- start:202 stop:414 length:213 start_codon:yes stop_codon:yes gene_type:complete
MNTPADALIPGAFLVETLAAFMGLEGSIPQGLHFAFSVFAAILFWGAMTKFTWVCLRRLFGFDKPQRGQR